jgi:MazG family protein
MKIVQRGQAFPELVALMQRLLSPEGCPWDREQSLATLRSYLLEETYEVLEAIDGGDPLEHKKELGDLLFQVVFQAELRAAEGSFGIDDVVRAIVDKMVSRHPHVFGDAEAKDAAQVLAAWGRLKAEEDARRGRRRRTLDGVPETLPALLAAQRIGEKAAQVGFDWPDAKSVRDKIAEELVEIEDAVKTGDAAAIEAEVGDLLLAVSRYAAKLGVSPEDALRNTLRRFRRRFEHMEDSLEADGAVAQRTSPDEWARLWDGAKRTEAGLPKK